MFPSIPELKPPVSSHEGPYLKARRLRQTKATPRRSSVSTTYTEFKVTRSAGPHERALPGKSIGSAVSDGETVRRSSTCGGSEDGAYEEVITLSNNKFSPTTYFKGIDCGGKTAHAETNPLLKRRSRSVALHNNRAVWNADVSASNANDLLSPSTQHQRLAVQLKLVEEAKEKRIRRDLHTLRQSKSITLTGGEASLVVRDHKKTPPEGYIKVSPDKMTKAGRELYFGKNFEKPSCNPPTPPENQTKTTTQATVETDHKGSGASETQDSTIKVPTAGLNDPDDDNDREESSTRVHKKREKKGSAKKRTTAAVREKRTKARERRRAQIKEMKPSEETPENEEKQQKKSRPVVESSSDSDADLGKNKTGSAEGGERSVIAIPLARQPPRLRRMMKKKMEAAQQQKEGNAEPAKPVKVTVKEVSDLIAFVNLETKTHMKKHLPEADNNPDSNIDYKTLSELLPTSLNDDMLKYLKTLYDYFRIITTCGLKEAFVLAAVAKRLGSKKSLLGRVRLKQPVDEITPGDVKEFMVKFSSFELCGQVTSSKLKEVLTSSTPTPQSVVLLEDNMETYLCKDNPRLLHKLDFFAYLPYLLSF